MTIIPQSFDQARAMYGSDAQMARDLFAQLVIVRIDLELQQALRRRAEDRLHTQERATCTGLDSQINI